MDAARAAGRAAGAISAAIPAQDVAPEQSAAPPREATARAEPVGLAERPAEVSDREADARALAEPVEIRPGRPAAAQGLEIRTVRPQWRHATLLTARPRNPVVEVTFGRDGRVKRAAFASASGALLSTGYADVDEPLLNAVYKWTARGEALERLSEGAGLTISMRIILSG